MPIWNASVKSPCIDNGNSDTNGINGPWMDDLADRDTDNTPLDIGAVFLEDGHLRNFHRLNNQEVKWICIPGVIDFDGNDSENTLQYVFDTYQGNGLFATGQNRILDRISWIYNLDFDVAYPEDVPNSHVYSQYGYKVTMVPNFNGDKILQYTGYRPGNTLNLGRYETDLGRRTTLHYVKPPIENGDNCGIDDNTGLWYRTTYLGYYFDQSMEPFDALEPILNNITAILAEDWAMVRLPVPYYQYEPGDVPSDAYTNDWLGCVESGISNIAINPGEMVEIRH